MYDQRVVRTTVMARVFASGTKRSYIFRRQYKTILKLILDPDAGRLSYVASVCALDWSYGRYTICLSGKVKDYYN